MSIQVKLFPYERVDYLSMQEIRQDAAWSITAFNLPEAWKECRGEGVIIGVVDSGCDLDHPDLADNLLPGVNIVEPGKHPEDNVDHGCVHPDTLVHTSYCGIEKISTLYDRISVEAIYDAVSKSWIKDVRQFGIKTYSADKTTGKTNVSKIEFVHKTHVEDDIISVDLSGGLNIKLTKWHIAYLKGITPGGRKIILRKRADELVPGDNFFRPNGYNCGLLVSDNQEITGGNYHKCINCNHVLRCLRGTKNPVSKCKKCGHFNWEEYNKTYQINQDLAYVAGMVLTDGYITDNRLYRVEVTSNTIEILQKMKDCLNRMGFLSNIDKPKNYCTRLLCYSKELVRILTNLGISNHRKSYEQTLPEWVGKSPRDVIAAFLAGVIDGDGCINTKNSKNRITTASLPFANKLSYLLNSMNISAYVQKYKNTLFKSREINKNRPFIYNVTFSSIYSDISKHLAHPTKLLRTSEAKPIEEISGKKITRGVKEITTEYYNGYFYDFTVQEDNNYVANGVMVSNTHITGILVAEDNDIGVVGVAPKAKVCPVKVLDAGGNGTIDNVIAGIRWCIQQRVNFINLSFGCPAPLPRVREVLVEASKAGIITFCAAGNAGKSTQVFYPATYPETIAIGAIDPTFHRAIFSNTGTGLDFLAPGVDILSTVPNNWYAKLSGTSMAGPFACGVSALLLSYVQKNPNSGIVLNSLDDYIRVLKEYTMPIINGSDNPEFYQGFGIIDPRKFVESMRHMRNTYKLDMTHDKLKIPSL